MTTRHALRTGEYLAIASDAIHHDAGGFFFLLGGESPENEDRGDVTVVNVRGALCQFKGEGGDSYEALIERVGDAIASEPEKIVLRVSSPGGVVAGLNETVFKLQRMSKAAKIPLVACVDELAASAGYALCCACSEILAPPSAIIGSVGVISTMVSAAEADKKEGVDFRIITSGKRKADGHLHMPISKDAVSAEEARNEELAQMFFELAGEARGLSPKKLRSLEAAIYLGRDAERVGLIDDVMSFDRALFGLGAPEVSLSAEHAPNEGNATDRRAKDVPLDTPVDSALLPGSTNDENRSTPELDPMSVKLSALIRTTEASIASETDPKKLNELRVKLGAFLQTRAEMDDDDGDDDKNKDKDDDDDDDDGDSAASKHAARAAKLKAKAKATEHRAKAAEHKSKAAELEEEAKKCEEEASGSEEDDDEEEEARLLVRPASAVVSHAGLTPGQAAAIAAQGDIAADALKRVEALERSASARELTARIEEAKAQRRITPGEAKKLATKSPDFVKDFLEMRPRALVSTTEEALFEPDVKTTAGDIPADVKALIESDIKSKGLDAEKAKTYREESYAAQRAANAGALNGARGVY